VGYIGWAHDVRAIGDALLAVRLDWLLALWLVTIIAVFLADVGCLTLLFSRLNAPVTYRELLPVKGASYFLNIVNYNAAAGAVAWFLRKTQGVPFLEAASSMLWLNVIDLIALNAYVTAGLLLAGDAFPADTRATLWLANGALYAVYVGSAIYWNAGFDFFVLGRLRGLAIFSAFRRATVGTHLQFLALRASFLMLYVVMQFASVRLFGIEVPFGMLLVYNAIITFIGTIPISIAGLGTTQLAMLAFYGPYGSDAQILAYSTATIAMFAAARALIGYFYLGEITRKMGWSAESTVPKS
jgi:uncharacterized membrane protein YbhN (UPF0104 family)